MKKLIPCVGVSFFVLVGCAASGPLLKPNQDSRREFVLRHRELTETIKQAILEGRVIEGMKREDVKAAWGNPSRIVDFSTHPNPSFYDAEGEGWWYKAFFLSLEPTRFVKFKNGIVDYVSEDYK